jgi:ADP-heptose:LPS heptosyltransferase
VKELAALISMSSLFVANSTGPVHVAAALGIPVVGLYPWQTAMSAKRWGPYSERKVVLSPKAPEDCPECDGHARCACMDTIGVDAVVGAAYSLLDAVPVPAQGKGSYD